MRTPAPGSPLLHRRDWLAAVPLWALGATGCSTLPPEGTPLQISDYGLPFVAATVDGMEVLALVDSGSASSVRISQRLARRLRLALTPVPGARISGLDGRSLPVERGELAALTLAGRRWAPLAVEVTGTRLEDIAARVGTGFDLQIGWRLLEQAVAVLDYPVRRFRWADAPGLGGLHIPYALSGGLPVVQAVVAGRPVALLVDTGAPENTLGLDTLGQPAGTLASHPLQLGTLERTPLWRAKDLTVTQRALGTAGTLGTPFLREFRVTILSGQRQLQFG